MKKEKPQQKGMSVEQLARVMQNEFLGVHSEFSNVHKRLDRMDAEFAHVHKRLDTVERDISEMKKNTSELFTKLDEFISLYKDTKQELTVVIKQLKRLEERVAYLEGKK